MSYQLPRYIVSAELNNPIIDYSWYDPDPTQCFEDAEFIENIIEAMQVTGLRAKIALNISIYEWILGRFNQLTVHQWPYQLAEAAWCVNINVAYVPYFELDNKDYSGPVDRALFFSMVCLQQVIFVSDNTYDLNDLDDEEKDPEYIYSGQEWQENLKYLVDLTLHILPSYSLDEFKSWLNEVTNRLIELYSLPPIDPYDNLFGQDNNESLLGDYVPREVFDLDYNFTKDQTIPLINRFLELVDKTNPLLRPINELKKKIANPYYIEE